MEDNGYRFGVGVLVLASAIVGVLLIAFFGAVPKFWVERYRFTVNFETAPNVTVDTPVRKNGVLIGRVANVELRKTGGVDILLEVDRKFELTMSETPRIKMGSIISNSAVIEFMKPSQQALLARFDSNPRDGVLDEREAAVTQEVIGEKSYVSNGEVVPDPLEAVGDLVALANSLRQMAERLDGVLSLAQDAVGGGTGPLREVTTAFSETLGNINTTVSTINRIGNQVENARIADRVADALNAVPDLFKDAQVALRQTQSTLKGFEEFSRSLESLGKEFEGIGESVQKAMKNANEAIENIAEITEPISKRSDVLAEDLVKAVSNINALATDLKAFSDRLNRSNGTIMRLVDDPTMYGRVTETVDSIRRTSQNVELISRKLQPVIDNVRVASDKLARDPRIIGAAGVISNRPLGAGSK